MAFGPIMTKFWVHRLLTSLQGRRRPCSGQIFSRKTGPQSTRKSEQICTSQTQGGSVPLEKTENRADIDQNSNTQTVLFSKLMLKSFTTAKL